MKYGMSDVIVMAVLGIVLVLVGWWLGGLALMQGWIWFIEPISPRAAEVTAFGPWFFVGIGMLFSYLTERNTYDFAKKADIAKVVKIIAPDQKKVLDDLKPGPWMTLLQIGGRAILRPLFIVLLLGLVHNGVSLPA